MLILIFFNSFWIQNKYAKNNIKMREFSLCVFVFLSVCAIAIANQCKIVRNFCIFILAQNLGCEINCWWMLVSVIWYFCLHIACSFEFNKYIILNISLVRGKCNFGNLSQIDDVSTDPAAHLSNPGIKSTLQCIYILSFQAKHHFFAFKITYS